MAATPLAKPDDVAAIWRPLTDTDRTQVLALIDRASAKLRQACPFDIDERIQLFEDEIDDRRALSPVVVADVVATIVKRFLVNPDGFATKSQTVGPYSQSGTYVNRYDKTGSDVRGAIQITDSDIDQLRPAVPAAIPSSIQVGVPAPALLVRGRAVGRNGEAAVGPTVIPDIAPGTGVE